MIHSSSNRIRLAELPILICPVRNDHMKASNPTHRAKAHSQQCKQNYHAFHLSARARCWPLQSAMTATSPRRQPRCNLPGHRQGYHQRIVAERHRQILPHHPRTCGGIDRHGTGASLRPDRPGQPRSGSTRSHWKARRKRWPSSKPASFNPSPTISTCAPALCQRG